MKQNFAVPQGRANLVANDPQLLPCLHQQYYVFMAILLMQLV